MSIGLLGKILPQSVVHEAASADAAQLILDTRSIDWMVLDHNMPGTTGLDFAQLLKKTHPRLTIALLTANIQDATQQRAAELGLTFFRKPINEPLIKDIVALFMAQTDQGDR